MAEFLVRRGGPDAVLVTAPAAKGAASVSCRVRGVGAGRRVTVPDRLVAGIHPDHARHLVRLTPAEAVVEVTEAEIAELASEPPTGPDEQPTMPATPEAFESKRRKRDRDREE